MKHKWLLFLIMPISAFADDLITSDVPNGCSYDLNNPTYLYATFTPKQYQCNAGYYLPANNDGCVICPEYYDCNGGTFIFNEDLSQGAKFKTFITQDITNGCRTDFTKAVNNTTYIPPVFTPNVHTCTPGYYLPANVDECVPCPQNNKCVGGTYTFNETITQGIEQCANNTFAPTGSSVCYPHILHVGINSIYVKSTKQTTPSLNIKINNDVFYANMTTTPTYMNKDSEHYFKTRYNNQIYYVCDDTTCGE